MPQVNLLIDIYKKGLHRNLTVPKQYHMMSLLNYVHMSNVMWEKAKL